MGVTAAERRRYRELAVRDTDRALANAREERNRTIEVESRSRPGHFYEVRIALDGALLCPCPAGLNGLKCWHLEEARRVMTTTTRDLAIRPVVLDRMALVPTTEMIDGVRTAAKLAMGGRMTLPVELDSEPKVMAVMLYGLELGLRPMTALKHLYIVKGKVEKSSEVMAGMLMRADPKAKLIVEKLEVHGSGTSMTGICTMRIVRPSRDIDQRLSVDWEQIKRAGLARENNLLYPEDRLRYHCTKRLLRIYAPDLINAFDDGLTGPSIEALQAQYGIEGAPEQLADADAGSLYNEGDEEEPEAEYRVIDTETGEITQASDDQQARIKALWNPKHHNAGVIRERYSKAFPMPGTGGVNSPKALTGVEADEVIALLQETPATEPCDHEAVMDEGRSIHICAKCKVPLEGPDAVQAPALPI